MELALFLPELGSLRAPRRIIVLRQTEKQPQQFAITFSTSSELVSQVFTYAKPMRTATGRWLI
jgi:hypothetical protein